jgi:hypothetical protein
MSISRTFFVVLADLDDFVNVLLLEGSCDDNEVVLSLLELSQPIFAHTHFFFEWVAKLNNRLLLHQSLGHARLALLAKGGP